jgi:hypothetical protein
MAAVPLLTATAWAAPWRAAKRSSSSRPMRPRVSWPLASASSISVRMARRSSSGKCTCAAGTRNGTAVTALAGGLVTVMVGAHSISGIGDQPPRRHRPYKKHR